MTEYVVVVSRFVGDEHSSRLERYPDSERFQSRKAAIKHGYKMCDSDDFNIAELNGDTLVRFWWMNECRQFDEELAEIAAKCGWSCP